MSATGFQRRRREQGEQQQTPEPVVAQATGKPIEIGGSWIEARKRVKALLDMDRQPRSKTEARQLLEAAGYEVA